ncbi:hypothetical protein IHQ68_10150 [Chelatococcus sambhunathii]|uniref:Uncharacterized protein n=1 Tax=Chelatococcus sambhunathii TaxID=363953 RepID=A0ABU1DG53_9HYPH|nr:hypothetical protein [Chelatococcus sambhunathii]MDR4306979.1 hypothetical protein [Chelatococcus sambhunathii]
MDALEKLRGMREGLAGVTELLLALLDDLDGDEALEDGDEDQAVDDGPIDEDELDLAVDDIGEPTYGSIESYPTGANLTSTYHFAGAITRPGQGDQTCWGGGPTPASLDELEPVCEDEGGACEDEGGEHDGREPEDGI